MLLLLAALLFGAVVPVTGSPTDCELKVEIKKELSNTGQIMLVAQVTGGQAPFMFQWSNGAAGPSIPLDPSVTIKICVTVADQNGCTATACWPSGPNDGCEVEIKANFLNNSGSSAKLTAVPKGVGPFTYLWSTGEMTESIMASQPGTYCVTVTGADGCQASDCFTLKGTGPADCGVFVQVQYQGGQAKLVAQPKGVAPFKIQWSNGSNDPVIIVDQPGEYCVIVVDANGCEAKNCQEVVFENNGDCGVKISMVPANTPNGVALQAFAFGQAPFTFLWSNGATTPVIVVNTPGEYCVKVTDASGCEAKACIKVPFIVPEKCHVSILKSGPSPNNAGIVLTAQPKGAAPFQFSWSNGQTGQSITVTQPGEYCVKMIDANGCESSACITIKDPNTDPGGCFVYLKMKYFPKEGVYRLLAVPKGQPPFKFLWSNGESGHILTVKDPGLYCVTVVDNAGCESKACLEIEDPGIQDPDPGVTGFQILNSYPVPSTTEVFYELQIPEEGSLFTEVLNLTGKAEFSKSVGTLPAGVQTIQIPLQNLAPGVYILRLHLNGEILTSKIVRKEG